MRDFTKQHSSNTPDLRNEYNGSPFKAFSAFAISVISLIIHFSGLFRPKSLFGFHRNGLKLSFAKSAVALFALLIGMANVSKAQNAPLGEDKYYMLVGELLGNSTARTDVYQYTTGGGISNCSLSGGGGEGMVVDPVKNLAYIATCCNVGEVRIYDYNTAAFLTPITFPGEDILDVALSADRLYLYVATYNFVYKVNTDTKQILGSVPKSTFNIAGTLFTPSYTVSNFWGMAVSPTNSRIYATTNWQTSNDDSKIVSFSSSLSGFSVIATAPAGFHYRGIVFDASGNIWAAAASESNSVPDRVYKYSSTGTYLDEFIFGTPLQNGVSGTGKVDPYDLAFGPDGKLYITTFWGDCVSKLDVSNSAAIPTTYLPYVAGAQAKSITFVGGNFKCICTSPVLSLSNLTQKTATCNGAIPNSDASVTIGGLVYNSQDIVKGDINEGSSYGQIPLYNALSNETLSSGQTSLTFTGLKANTTYTIRVWSGKDACYSDLTFTTYQGVCFTCVCTSNNFAVNGDMASGNPPSSWTTPQGQWSLGTGSSTGNFGVLNNSDFNSDYYAYQDIPMTPGAKITFDALAATHAVSTSGAIAEMYLEFYNGTTWLATSSKSNTTVSYNGTLVALNTIKFIAPANTTHVRIVAHSKGRALKFDNVVLTRCYDAINLTLGSKVDPNCNVNNGSITVVGSSGSGSYEFRINGGAWQTSNVFSNLSSTSTGTNYSVEIRDKNAPSCTKTLPVSLVCVQNCNIVIGGNIIKVTTFGGTNGSIDVTVTGGIAPYTYLWTDGATTQDRTNLKAGVYWLKVTDAQGCEKLWQFIVDQPTGDCSGFRTQTQGGWGSKENGENPGSYRDANFAAAFPSGLTVGCGTKLLKLTTAKAVEDFLPSGSTPSVLPAGTLTNPAQTYSNTLAGQVVALTLNIGFDNYDANFGSSDVNLKNLKINSGVFAGKTVQFVLDEANKVLGGCTSAYLISDLNTVVTNINENFVNGTSTGTFLDCVQCNIVVNAGADKNLCNTDEVVLDGTVSGVSTCGTPGTINCANTISGSTGWIADLNTAKVCGDNNGAKLWTKSGQGTSSITLDLGSTLPAGTIIRVNLKLEHCENTLSTQSDAKIEASLSSGPGFTSLVTSLLFNHTSYKEYTYTLTSASRYIKVSDNGKCALRLDYIKYNTPDTFTDAVTYSWSGTGIVGATNQKSVTVNQAGTYTFTVTDCYGCIGSDIVVVTKNTVTANAGPDKEVCLGETVTLTATAVAGATYEWRSSTSSTVISTNQSITVTPTATIDYVLTVIKNGCDESDEVKVTVKPNITVDAGADKTICNTDEVVLDGSVSGVTSCGTPGVTNCATTIAGSTAWIADLNTAKVCGDNAGAKLWTKSGQGVSSITLDLGSTLPAGTVIRVNLKLEHCENTTSTQSDAKIEASLSSGSGFTSLASSLLFNHTSYKEYTYTLTSSARYIKVSDNGKCALRLDYVKFTTPDTYNNAVTYSWSGPGIVGANNTKSVTVNQAGTYTFTVTGCNGCSGTDIVVVTKNTVSADAGTDKSICVGESVTLTATPVVGATYEWRSSTSSTVISTNASITVTPTATTDYVLTVLKNGCDASDEVKVTVNPKPTVTGGNIPSVDPICVGQTATLKAGTWTNASTYTWTGPAGFVTQNGQTATTTVAGTYTLTVTSVAGCSATATVALVVNTNPIINVDSKTVCLGGTATLTASNCVGTVTWNTGATTNTITVTPSAVGEVIYTATCQNTSGCTATGTGKITTLAKPTVSLGPDVEICLGKSIDLVATGCAGGTISWNQGITATTSTVTVSPTTNTTYTVTCKTSNNDGCIATDDILVKVNPNPTGSIPAITPICQTETLNLLSGTWTNAASYKWAGPNSFSSTSQNPTITNTSLAAAGTYTLTVTSASGCTTTATVAVTVNACLSKIGDFVWEDINGNGIQDSGEPGIPGVSVTLNGTDAFGNVVSQTATTGANGEYLFDNLVKGTYTVTFGDKAGYVLTSPNKGTDDAKDSDADLTTKQSPVINLGTNASNLTIDAGMYRPASLGDFVWYDINNNGIQDSGEPGIQGVVVTLNGTKGDGTVIAAQTSTTNASGIYAFTNLAPGTYTVTFGTVGGYQVAKQDITGANTDATDVNNDSDINSTTLTSHAATLVSGENDPKLDAGFTKVIDLELDKTVSNPTPNVGETVTYTLKLTNKGPQIATGVALEDVIPNGLENIILTATNSPQGVIAGNKITFSGLTVLKDETKTFTYTAKVKEPLTGVVYKNVAQVTASNEYDIDSTPNNDDGDQSEDDEDPETI
ncbi:DUF11 domain-containing protein, partial [Lacihabitans sp. CCS-44]|uniref:SdrD B-like domain-containing protein n=1 Tax=Lacihabitans sp. CCS-44 TaxID=2487331 RepID=UPI0026E55DB6